MNLSRLATLAVFFMMVMSAFVTVPTYNVGADEHETMIMEMMKATEMNVRSMQTIQIVLVTQRNVGTMDLQNVKIL